MTAMLFILQSILFTISFLVFYAGYSHYTTGVPQPLAGLMAVAVIPGLLGAGCRKVRRRLIQRRRDEKAEAILQKIRAHGRLREIDKPFFLYLRPFESMGKIKIPKPLSHPSTILMPQPLNRWAEDTRDLETSLQAALDYAGPLVGVGSPIEDLSGPGQIVSSDEDWQGKIKYLMRETALIFVIPAANLKHAPSGSAYTRAGIAWEIDQILSDRYLSKTIFIMPPMKATAIGREQAYNPERCWEEFKRFDTRLGHKMPDYDKRGALVVFKGDGETVGVRKLNVWRSREIRLTILAAAKVLKRNWDWISSDCPFFSLWRKLGVWQRLA